MRSLFLIALLFFAGLPASAQFFVSTTGNDSNSGSITQPFKTLAKCQTAMQGSVTKTCYIRAGAYSPSQGGITTAPASCGTQFACGCPGLAAVYLVAGDNGETWSYYPSDGVNSAILDGGAPFVSQTGAAAAFSGAGVLSCAFASQASISVTITGLTFQFWRYGALDAVNGAYTFTSNILHDFRQVSDGGTAVLLGCGSSGSTVSNNYISNMPYHGISLAPGKVSQCATAISNVTIANNRIANVCTWEANILGANGGDCGGIYAQAQVTSNSNIHLTNNYISDINVSSNGNGNFVGCCAMGIYLDGDYNFTLNSNVIIGIKSAGYSQNGGGNIFTNNIIDVGNPGYEFIAIDFNEAGISTGGSAFTNNIITANGNTTSFPNGSNTGDGFVLDHNTTMDNPMAVTNNAYWNYNGTSVKNTGDTNPTYEDPKLSGWSVGQFLSSSVFNPPVSWSCLAGAWGPPGFAIPTTGTAPSWPLTNIGTGCIGNPTITRGFAVIY